MRIDYLGGSIGFIVLVIEYGIGIGLRMGIASLLYLIDDSRAIRCYRDGSVRIMHTKVMPPPEPISCPVCSNVTCSCGGLASLVSSVAAKGLVITDEILLSLEEFKQVMDLHTTICDGI